MAGVKKSTLVSLGVTLISLYFIFNGLETLTNQTTYVRHFDRKIYNIEAYLANSNLLLFSVRAWVEKATGLIIIAMGLFQLVLGSMFLFFEDKHYRKTIVECLVVFQLFQAFVVHQPFIENSETLGIELKHFLTNLMIGFGLIMVLGLRK